MAYMGSGESGRKAVNISSKERNSFHQGRTGSKVPILPGVVKGVRHNKQESGGINRATKGIGSGKTSY